MPLKYDLTGKRFGRLVAHYYEKPMWVCECDCGSEHRVLSGNLRSGDIQSCGCLMKDVHTKHGMYTTKTYATWEAMNQRVNNPNSTHYSYYGGRGVSVCDRWSSFEAFYCDMGERPEGMSLDRIDANGDYTPENCRWVSHTAQMENRRAQKNSPYGIGGVGITKSGKFRVRIKSGRKERHLGVFSDFFEACCARKSAELKFFEINQGDA